MIGGREPNSTGSLSIVLHQWTGGNSLGWSLLVIGSLGTPLNFGMPWRDHMQSPGEGRACRSFGRSTRWILHYLAMSTTMKEHALFTRYKSIETKLHSLHLLQTMIILASSHEVYIDYGLSCRVWSVALMAIKIYNEDHFWNKCSKWPLFAFSI